jgi:hypothetical protein
MTQIFNGDFIGHLSHWQTGYHKTVSSLGFVFLLYVHFRHKVMVVAVHLMNRLFHHVSKACPVGWCNGTVTARAAFSSGSTADLVTSLQVAVAAISTPGSEILEDVS